LNMKTVKLILVALLFSILPAQAAELKPYTGSMQASEFTLKDMQGKTHRLSQYRGKVVLVNFWATWCPPCIEELPSLQRLLELYEDKDFTILTIDVGEPAELIQPFLSQVGVNDLTVLLDDDGTTHKNWNIYVFPTNFLLDQSGKIRYAAVGALNWDEQNVIDTINKLLE